MKMNSHAQIHRSVRHYACRPVLSKYKRLFADHRYRPAKLSSLTKLSRNAIAGCLHSVAALSIRLEFLAAAIANGETILIRKKQKIHLQIKSKLKITGDVSNRFLDIV